MINFTSIQPYRLPTQVADLISKSILSGELTPGSRLPSERELAVNFRISRPTLREAIHVLEALGLVEIRHGDGTYVSKTPSALSPRVLKQMLVQDDTLLLEMVEVRKEVEVRNAALAANHATNDEIAGLGRILDAMETDVRAGRDDFERDVAFHLAVAEASHNRIRLFITTSVLLAHSETLHEARHRMIERQRHLVEDFLRAHREVYRGIRGREPAAAAKAMMAHLEDAYTQYAALAASAGPDTGGPA
jgi:GntR family transcriptional repressor for pyruvate dehydrogenase complex